MSRAYAPAVWEAELATVVWMAVRAGVLPREEGHHRLDLASRLRIRPIPNRSVWQGALSRAVDTGVAVYDTLFVELAAREQLPLITFDAKVLQSFPDIACRPAGFSPEERSRAGSALPSGVVANTAVKL